MLTEVSRVRAPKLCGLESPPLPRGPLRHGRATTSPHGLCDQGETPRRCYQGLRSAGSTGRAQPTGRPALNHRPRLGPQPDQTRLRPRPTRSAGRVCEGPDPSHGRAQPTSPPHTHTHTITTIITHTPHHYHQTAPSCTSNT